jgi:hypothetical protein
MGKVILTSWHDDRDETGLEAVECMGEALGDPRKLKQYRLSNGSISWLPDSAFEPSEAKAKAPCETCGRE